MSIGTDVPLEWVEMLHQGCRTIAIVIMIYWSAVAHGALAEPKSLDLQELIRNLKVAESSILNLEVRDFELRTLRKNKDATEWTKDLTYVSGTAWYNGLPDSKMRVNYSSRIAPWEEGASPLANSQEDLGFDGKFGRVATHMSGPNDRMVAVREGAVLAQAPASLRSRRQNYATGALFSLNYYREQGLSLSQGIQLAIKSGVPVAATWDELEEERLVRVTFGDASDPTACLDTFWLDPTRGYAMRRHENAIAVGNASRRTVILDEVSKFVEACPGVWYPTAAVREEEYGSTRIRLEYQAVTAVCNNADFDEEVFTVRFPDGYRVSDRVKGVNYVAGPPPQALKTQLDHLVTEAMNLSTKESSRPVERVAEQHGVNRFVWLGLAALILFVLFVIVRLRPSSRKAMLLLLVCACASAAYGSPNAVLGNDYVRNCAVDVSYIACRWYHREVSVESLAQSLQVGPSYDQASSFRHIREVLVARDLRVAAYRIDELDDVLRLLAEPETCAILRLSRMHGQQDVGHFVFLAEASGRFILIDPPFAPKVLTASAVVQDMTLRQYSGEVLVVRAEAVARELRRPVIGFASTAVDLGQVPFNAHEITAAWDFHNSGSAKLQILQATSSCGCVDIQVDREVSPGAAGVLRVRFDRRKLSSGRIRQSVVLTSNDPLRPRILITFAGETESVPRAEEVFVSPRQIDTGRIITAKASSLSELLELHIPTAMERETECTFAAESDAPSVVLSRMPERDTCEGSMRVIAYRMTLREPSGALDSRIRFTVRNARNDVLADVVVPVTGECIEQW